MPRGADDGGASGPGRSRGEVPGPGTPDAETPGASGGETPGASGGETPGASGRGDFGAAGPDPAGRCPCGSGDAWSLCCGRYLAAHAAGGDWEGPPTAEALMRSRYGAFVAGDAAYLLATWHPDTRPDSLELDPGVEWRLLRIDAAEGGGPFDAAGTVEFTAHYRTADGRGAQHERSRFVREGGRWFYVDGDVSG